MGEVKADDVLRALESKHHRDLYAQEVTCGSAGGMRLDAWAMPRSWTRFSTIGYEVKVTRSDFLGDKKMQRYREFVHELYLVTPWKLVAPEECPEGVGLLWMQKTGRRVVCKRKAAIGEAPSHVSIMASLLINRARLDLKIRPPVDRLDKLRELMERRAEAKEVGHWVASTTSQELRRLHKIEDLSASYTDALASAREAGFWSVERAVEAAAAAKSAAIPPGAASKVRQAARSLDRAAGLLAELQAEAPESKS